MRPSKASSTTFRSTTSATAFLPDEPPELELTVVALEDGRSVLGVGLRPGVLDAQPDELTDITYAGSWRRYRGLPQPQN
ncbi:MAG: hypothetical protein U5N21_12715 [Rhodococcus sp. (in: high G+C Gram-positive bacteria)]|nr:hypothetical protein [Rhodococcus sp. (in: high G+C Gram-positive bacteria)]